MICGANAENHDRQQARRMVVASAARPFEVLSQGQNSMMKASSMNTHTRLLSPDHSCHAGKQPEQHRIKSARAGIKNHADDNSNMPVTIAIVDGSIKRSTKCGNL